MKKAFLGIILTGFLMMAFKKPEPVAYKWFDKNGKEVEWKEVVKHCSSNEVVFFGELHNNPITHWLQLKLTQDLYDKNNQLVLGAEMFEADQQSIMNEYLSKVLPEKNFEAEMRLWTNYKTDYKPLLSFALEKGLPFIATNVPRRYASIVSKKGKDELIKITAESKKFLCPLPYEVDTTLPGYVEIMKMNMGHGSNLNMVYAQALKDATMAYFIQKNIKEKGLFLHYNGAYHSDNYEGIVYYLKKNNSKLSIATLSTVSQKEVNKLEKENLGKADFILVVDEQMTTTH